MSHLIGPVLSNSSYCPLSLHYLCADAASLSPLLLDDSVFLSNPRESFDSLVEMMCFMGG